MERGRRDREGSPTRQSRAELLRSIAERRAQKNAVSNIATTILTAHSTPLPESGSSGSETEEEFLTPEPRKSSPGTLARGLSASKNSPVDLAKVRHSQDDVSSVLPELGVLSLSGKQPASENGNSSSSGRVQETSVTSTATKKYAPPRETTAAQNYAHPRETAATKDARVNPSFYRANVTVELSSDEEEDVFQPTVVKHRVKVSDTFVNRATTSRKTKEVGSKFEFRREELYDESVDIGEETDIVLGEGAKKYVLPGRIAHKLYKHQQAGISWLWNLHIKKMGGILGDDMGLGKTMQIAAFFAGLFNSKLIRTAMVVAPKTLISHWIKELSNVGLSRKIHSFVEVSAKAREYALQKALQVGGVLLTTYDMVRCNYKILRGDLHGRDGHGDNSDDIITWDYVVLDEGHLIKNPNTERAKSLRELPSAHRIIISGTPIQNNLKEMWALMDYCCPGLLGDQKEFKQRYEGQIIAGNDKYASDRQKRLGATVAQELRQKIAPFFLRRMKSEVFPENETNSEAPKLSQKNDFIVWLRLTSRQEQLYRAFLESEAVVSALDGSKALTALSVLKKICDHPTLLTKRAADDIAEGMEGMMGGSDPAEAEAMISGLAGLGEDLGYGDSQGAASCKIEFLFILLDKLLEEGHRTLVFSQTRKMLNMIQDEMEKKRWRYCRIDGTLKSSERETAVQEFQSSLRIPFFLLTSQVGGLGLTLTAADRVVILDPAWNPSVDNQSVDRAYRIGQKKDVTVYRLMTCGTIEEKIYRKQVFKGGLMKIATEEKNQMRYFSREELHDLFRVPPTGFSVSVTQQQLAEEHFGEHRTNSALEEHIKYLEGLSMIAGVSHHDLLYSKAAPALPPAIEDEDDANVRWEPRNVAYNRKSSTPASKVTETYTWDEGNSAGTSVPASGQIFDEAKFAYLRLAWFKDQIRRLAATLEDEATTSKLADGGAKIMKKIKDMSAEMEKLKVKAAPYMGSVSPPDGVLKRVDGNSQQQKLEGVTGRKSPVIPCSEPVVRVRSASDNNIYPWTAGETEVRKPRLPDSVDSVSDRKVNSLDDLMSSLRVQ